MRAVVKSLLGVLLALLLACVLPVSPARAASGYVLTASYGSGLTTTDTALTLRITYRHDGAKVKKATALLQYQLDDKTWVTEKTVKVRAGKGSTTVKHSLMTRHYRFVVEGKATSAESDVRFLPSGFTIAGSGFGHGVGLSQWGAYEQSRRGWSADQILGYYYQGTTVGTANDNPRTVKVQVLGPPTDSRRTTSLKVTAGGFTVSGDGTVLASYATPGTVSIGVSGSKVTAKVTLANGKVKKRVLKKSGRLTLTWTKGPVAVAGAQGSYQAGNLQVTVIGGRPNVVNQVAMNTDYLYGIDEMPSSWGTVAAGGAQALKAQVIAARTYVITTILKLPAAQQDQNAGAPNCDCHVYDDPRSQNYVGAKKSVGTANQPWVDAVDATIRPNAAMPDGKEVDVVRDADHGFAETPFFASSGSFTLDGTLYSGTTGNSLAWGTSPLGYLVHVDDPYSASAPGNPYVSWTRSLSQAKAQRLFGTTQLITSIDVTARYPGGLVQTLTATTSDGARSDLTTRTDAWRGQLGVPGAWVSQFTAR
jgi:stage II sporulation protein D